MKISTRISRLNVKIEKLNNLRVELQNQCPHDGLEGTMHGDSGNWVRGDDRYWVNLKCKDCGKYWTEDQKDLRWHRGIGKHYSKNGFLFVEVPNKY